MKIEKIFFILSVLSILILILITQATTPMYTGKIESIQHSNNKITIKIENSPTELIIFQTNFINLEKDDIIKFQGKPEIYQNKSQIILDKIYLSSNTNKH